MSEILRAVVYGPAGVQGSKCSFAHPQTGEIVIIESSDKSKDWRQLMIKEMQNDQPETPIDDAAYIYYRIYVRRPKSHYRKDWTLKPTAPKFPKTGKDMDKVERAIFDATKIARWVFDDARFARPDGMRLYTEDLMTPERVEVMVYNLEKHGLDFLNQVMARVTDGHPITEELVPK